MKFRLVSGLVLAFCVAASMTAFAGTVNMQFNNASGNAYNGVSSYPYYFSVDNTPENLMCIGYNEHITGGETWQATEMSVNDYGALIGNLTKAQELAFLYTLAYTDSGANGAINGAAWYLNEGVPPLDAASKHFYDLATSMTFGPGEFSKVKVYVPIDGTQSWAGEPVQTFYGGSPTPEPGTMLMLGSGIIGVASVLRRKVLL